MRILGLCFAGTATEHRDEMSDFVVSVLGLESVAVGGVDADMFALPDGSHFAVAPPRGMGETSRTVGFLVDDLDAAVVELLERGVEVDAEPSSNATMRYVHLVAPDGRRYELVERLDPPG